MTRTGRLRAAAALLVAVASVALTPAVPGRGVRAAAPDLTFVADTTYEVHPDEGRASVTLAITATNHLKDTTTKRYYFSEGYLAVQPDTTGYHVTAASGSPAVSVASRSAEAVVLRIRFGQRLAAGKSLALTLTYDLVDPGGAPDRPLRISPSIVTFQAWAHATPATPGSSVEVRLPSGYSATIGRGPLVGPATDADGWQTWSSGPLSEPLDFVADIDADQVGGYTSVHRDVPVGAQVVEYTIEAWPDDAAWRDRISDVFGKGLTALGDDIGLPWPFGDSLIVREVLIRGGSADEGTFDPAGPLVQIGYTAGPGVVIHEAAHGWFNGALVGDRWIVEAFAAYYGQRALATLGIDAPPPSLDDVPPDARIALNAWAPSDAPPTPEDDYGFAASLVLATDIAAVVGDGTLRRVWADAAAGRPAYQPPGGPDELGADPPDWRAFLDLLEADATPTQRTALDGLWLTWVARPTDVALISERARARAAYDDLLTRAGTWRLPASIRESMRTWQFADAEARMAQASTVLDLRAEVERAAGAAGLAPPETLRDDFAGRTGLAAAAAEAQTELAVLSVIRRAQAVRIAAPGPIDELGLLGLHPDADLEAAQAAFTSGDLDGALQGAQSATDAWTSVPDLARGRIIGGLLLAVAVVLLLVLIRTRRIRRAGWSR